jgi:hypothetical protein
MKCKKCDLCNSKIGVKQCNEKIVFNGKIIECICVNCIKKIDSYFNDFVLVYDGLKCYVTKRGKKLL